MANTFLNKDGLSHLVSKLKTYIASQISSHTSNKSNPHGVTSAQVGALPLSGGSLTGNLTAPSFQTGTGGANYFQCRKFRGEGNADNYYHAVDFGYAGHNQVDFYEYGGKYVFHRHQQAAQSSGDAIIGEINGNGFVGKVNGHTINADVPAGAKFTDTTYSNATTSASGLMSASDKSKLDGIAAGANKYTHPSYTAKSSGLYKVTVDGTGHVSAATAVTKADITALGIPGESSTAPTVRTFKAGDTYTFQNIYAIVESKIAKSNYTGDPLPGFCATLPGLVEEGTKIKVTGDPTELSALRYDGDDEHGFIDLYGADVLVLGNDGTKTTIVIPIAFPERPRQLCFVICKGLTLNFY